MITQCGQCRRRARDDNEKAAGPQARRHKIRIFLLPDPHIRSRWDNIDNNHKGRRPSRSRGLEKLLVGKT